MIINTSIESRENLQSVIGRLIDLIKNDLNELNLLLEFTDPFALKQKKDDVNLKRKRCTTLLKLLQNVLAVEMELDGKPTHIVTTEQSKAADKIMTLLRTYRLIEPSELAEYLKSAVATSNDDSVSSKSRDAECLYKQKLPKSIRKLKRVYDNR